MTAERLFLEFQRTRDPARLGQVFDLCADDLFAVALHLCRDRAAAEDAVQATFLVAIEQASRWDGARPLQPWLLGILHREVRQLRRRARQQPRPERVAVAAEPPPELSAMGAEVRAAVGSAIAALPEPYRGVVELRLVHALPPESIAARLSRSPGAVRTQLWRGLELLRRALPAGLGVALGTQLLGQPALAAVRSNVLQAARASGGAVVAGFTGVLLMKKVAIGAVLVAACAWAALQWGDASSVATPALNQQSASTAGGRAAEEPQAVAANEPMDAQRELVARDEARAASVVPAAQAVPSSQVVSVLVVDRRGDAVPEATIALFEADRSHRKEGEPAEQRRAGPPLAELHADAFGRCQVAIERECFIEAHKTSIGSSGDVRVWPAVPGLRLRVAPTVRVKGTVVWPDGAPAVGAEVTCWRNSWGIGNPTAAPPPPTWCDASGAFAFEVVPPGDYRMWARLGQSFSETEVQTNEGDAEKVVCLQFPGAFSVTGQLLDVDGKPIADAMLRLPRHDMDGRIVEIVSAKTRADGSFERLLTHGGRFEVLGGVAGQTLAHDFVELTDARPHQQVTLRTTPFAVVAGQVVDERGQLLEGVALFASELDPQNTEEKLRWQLYDTGKPRGATAADGTFRWLVPADLRFRIRYRPVTGVKEILVDGPDVTPPAESLRIVVTDADRQRKLTGFELRGRIVAAATGAPAKKVRIQCIENEASGTSADTVDGHVQPDGTFALGPLPLRNIDTFAFEFEAEGCSLRVGPFPAAERVEEVTVRLLSFAAVDVLVLRPDGNPAVGAPCYMRSAGLDPIGDYFEGQTDAAGRVHFDQVRPSGWSVHAWLQGRKIDCVDRDVTIAPGGHPELRLVLPR